MHRHKNRVPPKCVPPKKMKRIFDELPSQSEPRLLQEQERNEFTLGNAPTVPSAPAASCS